jgi:MFS family permease
LILKSRDIAKSDTIAILGYVFYNIIYAMSSYPAGLIADRLGKKNVFIVGLLIFSLVYLGFGFNNDMIIIWPLFAIYGIYTASTEGITKAWVADLIEDKYRGSGIGLLTSLTSLAIMLGSVITGILWDQFGPKIPFLISSGVALIVAVVLFFFKEEKPQKVSL